MSFIDSDHPEVVAFAERHARGSTDKEKAISLFYAVRDGFRYDPYQLDFSPPGMLASRVLQLGHGWCVPKAALLAACCRAQAIGARLGFADVRNHLSTERMRAMMKTDLYVWHGFTEIYLEGRWLKATPAFNLELCDRLGLLPLDWDGESDAIFHPYDRSGNRHMEYLHYRGSFDDIPLQQLIDGYRAAYPDWEMTRDWQRADFTAEITREN